MKIAVLSGKGGTGKTLVSVNLAAVIKNSTYIDCDVEEPNGHLFFKPEEVKNQPISVKIPFVDLEKCTGCRTCVDFCKFNALAYIGNKVKVFEDICHSCGGCMQFCPERAISEKDKEIGHIEIGQSQDVTVISGILNTGEATGVPIIKALLQQIQGNEELTVIDCPPGSACIVMESIKDADYCILVAEPTLFGVHNLNMVHDLVKLFNKPYGVVLNKCLEGDNPAEQYCDEQNICVLSKIPFNKELGTMNSNGLIVARESNDYHEIFDQLMKKAMRRYFYETVTHT